MIDLHTHTSESDGTCSPAELIGAAARAGVTTLAITDHDTFSGYDQASPHAAEEGVNLICGIELSTKLEGQSIHLLAYYLDGCPADARAWISDMQASRAKRNRELVDLLQNGGFSITMEEVQKKGQKMTGRPHFAQILVEKGYVANIQEAFDKYLDKSAAYYVDRDEPQLTACIERIAEQGGISSLAHPCRLKCDLDSVLPHLCEHGLAAIEVYYSDHTEAETQQFLNLAEKYALTRTGGSDFHGSVKPEIELGTGRCGRLKIPSDLLTSLRSSIYRR